MADKEINTVDARGLSCPQPVLMTKNALSESGEDLKIMVDSPTARDNVSKFGKSQGCEVEVEEEGEVFVIKIRQS